ncbi:hypothetical protein D3C85_1830470 [compost metagenome]
MPNVAVVSTLTPRVSRSIGMKSAWGVSMKSISPFISAACAVCWSGITSHSIRSALATLPPAVPLEGSLRGT